MKPNIETVLGVTLLVLAGMVIISTMLFTSWMDTRVSVSCHELKEMHFKEMPAGCV